MPSQRPAPIGTPPYADQTDPTWGGPQWPARWITPPGAAVAPLDVLYRLRFTEPAAVTRRLHVSADERYDLSLDGRRLGRGPERSGRGDWAFETYDVDLDAGSHQLLAWVSSPGQEGFLAPSAQLSRGHGFLLADEDRASPLHTAVAAWECQRVTGVTHHRAPLEHARFAGGGQHFDAAQMPWDALTGAGAGWVPVACGEPAVSGGPAWGEMDSIRPLTPARLPAMLESAIDGLGEVRHVGAVADPPAAFDPAAHRAPEAAAWRRLLADPSGEPVDIPAHTRRDVLIDLGDYYCAYPCVTLDRGRGATVAVDWSEALYETPEDTTHAKAHRDTVHGLHFVGKGDRITADGQPRSFEPLHWRAGRYVRLRIVTAGEPLHVAALRFVETRFPLNPPPLPEISDGRLAAALPLMQRAVLVCMHDTFHDTPYYEQLQYAGDTRLQALFALARGGDDRLPRRAAELFGRSLTPQGFTQARCPSGTPMIIGGFSLWWIASLHDLARWSAAAGAFVLHQLPITRAVLETFEGHLNSDGLLGPLPGWAFVDWSPGWVEGVPPGALTAPRAVYNWQLIYTLLRAAELEAAFGDPRFAELYRDRAARLHARVEAVFYCPTRHLYADDAEHTLFSEHPQCLAALSGQLAPDRAAALMRAMTADADLAPTTVYFSHYKIEALAHAGLTDALDTTLELWRRLPERGFVTTPEMPEPTRSDCHGWGGHPLYHVVATLLGVQPDGFGFDRVRFAPRPGPLQSISATIPHVRGPIAASCTQRDGVLHARITLSQGLHGTFVCGPITRTLKPGPQTFEAPLVSH